MCSMLCFPLSFNLISQLASHELNLDLLGPNLAANFSLVVGFAISRFFPEPGNREMGGPEPVNPGFGFRFCMSYG